jgi:hypothetical protein
MHRLLKSKLFWLAAVYVCIFVVALVFAINTEPESEQPTEQATEQRQCTIKDITTHLKAGEGLVTNIRLLESSPEDVYWLGLSTNHELTSAEIEKIYEITGENPVRVHLSSTYHESLPLYIINCQLKYVCELYELDFISTINAASLSPSL